MSGEPFGPPGTVYISGGAIPVAAIPLAAASRLLQNSRIGLNVARAEVAGQHGKKLSPGRGACRTVFAVSNTAHHLCPGCFLDCRIRPVAGGHITECRGCCKGGYCHMGAFAGAAAPSVLRLRGGTYQDGINQSMDMRTLTVGLNSNYPIPLLDFTGPGLAIDIRKVINTGTPVVCHGGIISKDGGQIGAGIATFPMEVYVDAMYAFLKKYGIE